MDSCLDTAACASCDTSLRSRQAQVQEGGGRSFVFLVPLGKMLSARSVAEGLQTQTEHGSIGIEVFFNKE